MRFKNTKKKKSIKKAQPQKSPRNYRIIPENWNKDEFTFFIGAVFILGAILVVSLDLFSNLSEEKALADQKVNLVKQQNFWQNQVNKRANYRDAYYNLALVEFELRNIEGASDNLGKALSLDPNFKEGIELRRQIKGE